MIKSTRFFISGGRKKKFFEGKNKSQDIIVLAISENGANINILIGMSVSFSLLRNRGLLFIKILKFINRIE